MTESGLGGEETLAKVVTQEAPGIADVAHCASLACNAARNLFPKTSNMSRSRNIEFPRRQPSGKHSPCLLSVLSVSLFDHITRWHNPVRTPTSHRQQSNPRSWFQYPIYEFPSFNAREIIGPISYFSVAYRPNLSILSLVNILHLPSYGVAELQLEHMA